MNSRGIWLQMKYAIERRMTGALGTAASNVSSSYPRTNEAVANVPRIQELKVGGSESTPDVAGRTLKRLNIPSLPYKNTSVV